MRARGSNADALGPGRARGKVLGVGRSACWGLVWVTSGREELRLGALREERRTRLCSRVRQGREEGGGGGGAG
jgi:hypothetical protein